MWNKGWREKIWKEVTEPWDVIIVGGGITGAGILAEATRRGYKALLVEAKDFGYGTSSRSSKLVHGGLRYMKQAQFHLTLESVRERDKLLREAEGLVMPLKMYGLSLQGDKTKAWVFGLGLRIYDVFSRKWKHKRLSSSDLINELPVLQQNDLLRRGFQYYDTQADDARLVLRVLRDAVKEGGTAINYASAKGLLRRNNGEVTGIILQDQAGDKGSVEVHASIVINAAGIWSDQLRKSLGKKQRLRAIRGSHIVFPASKFPLNGATTMFHPRDNRAVFAIPWEGVVLLGTTDADHKDQLDLEPKISTSEAEYIAEILPRSFPSLNLSLDDAISSYAGVRPVVDTGKVNPTRESREHAVWLEQGLLTIAGGKLTTFQRMAIQAMNRASRYLPPARKKHQQKESIFSPPSILSDIKSTEQAQWLRLQGRYGSEASDVLSCGVDRFETIGSTVCFWNELCWAAQEEGVVHLEDLLLRRVRLGILLPNGGSHLLPKIQKKIQGILGWSDQKWQEEEQAYLRVQRSHYQLNL